MYREDILIQCGHEGEEIVYAKKDNRELLENFSVTRKYWFDSANPESGMVFIEEEGKLTGIVMKLNVKE